MMQQSTMLSSNEFRLMRNYIEQQCGISLSEEKSYLVESRLTTLMVESGCTTFTEFHAKAVSDKSHSLRDKIVDAITTNETLWFRDEGPFTVLTEVIFKELAAQIALGKRSRISIWFAACSTGQEPYSVAITYLESMKKYPVLRLDHLSIIATDISPSALFLARSGRYDTIAMSRGMPHNIQKKYFKTEGRISILNDSVKQMVKFDKFNLQDNCSRFGPQDIILCRNVLIYFSDLFKQELLGRLKPLLDPSGYLFLGSSESATNYSSHYMMVNHPKSLYYKVK